MSDSGLVLGIDCGDLEVRAAYVLADAMHVAPSVKEQQLVLYFEPNSLHSNLGVSFPSIVQSIGSRASVAIASRVTSPEQIVQDTLARICEDVEAEAREKVCRAVLAVPAELSAHRRSLLLECAARSGLPEAQLIDQCTAAALGYHQNADLARTIMVIQLGYTTVEYALVRLSKGKCRVLVTGSANELAQSVAEADLLERVVLALREKQIYLGLKQFTSNQWLALRRLVESAYLLLCVGRDATLSISRELAPDMEQVKLLINAQPYHLHRQAAVDHLVDVLRGALESEHFESHDIDEVVVVSDAPVHIGLRATLREAFDRRAVRFIPRGVVAYGAAWRACQLVGANLETWLTMPESVNADLDESLSAWRRDGAGVSSVLIDVIAHQAAPDLPAATHSSLPPAIREDGRSAPPWIAPLTSKIQELDAAFAQLKQVVQAHDLAGIKESSEVIAGKVQSLGEAAASYIAGLEQSQTPSNAALELERARGLFHSFRYEEAVAASHHAYELDQHDPEILNAMMQVHVDAALAMNRPEEYERAIQVLQCAHHHDPTYSVVHKALAQRHFKQGQVYYACSNMELAKEVLYEALRHDPKHAEAIALMRAIDGSGANQA